MTMMYAGAQAPYGMYGVQPGQPGYGQQITAPQALNMVPNVLAYMCQSGMCTQTEAAYIQRSLASYDSQKSFSDSIFRTYGNTQVHPNQIQAWVVSKLSNVVQKLRLDASAVQPMPSSFGQAPQAMPTYGYQNAGSTQPAGVQNLAEVYGRNIERTEAYQTTPPGSVATVKQVVNAQTQEQPSKVDVPQKTHTGQLHDIDLSDNKEVWPAAKYTQMRPPKWVYDTFKMSGALEEIEQQGPGDEPVQIDNKIMTLTNYGQITCSNVVVESCETRVKFPQNSIGDSAKELVAVAPELADDSKKFAHCIDAEVVTLVEAPYDETTQLLDECRSYYLEPDPVTGKRSLRGAEKVLKHIGQGNNASVVAVVTALLKAFNNAAGVNFIQRSPQFGCVTRIEQFTNLARFSRLLTDSGEFQEWKPETDTTNFPMAMKNCMHASFGSLFRDANKAYLDLNDPNNVQMLLSSGKVHIVVNETPGRLINYAAADDATKNEILSKLKAYTPILSEHKICFHNLHLTDDLDGTVGKVYAIFGSAEAQVLYNLFNKYGVMQLVSTKDPLSYEHPLIMGVSYDNQLLVRRI